MSYSRGTYPFPKEWSEWFPDTNSGGTGGEVRYRETAPGEYEYDYSNLVPRTVPAPSAASAYDATPDPYPPAINYTHSEDFQGSQQVRSLTQSFGNIALNENSYRQPQVAGPPSFYIRTQDPDTKVEEFDPHYKVQKSEKFKWGKIIKILWSEPEGSAGTGESITTRKGNDFRKVRRFVIIDTRGGHSLCLPIATYGGQGVMKRGVHARDHTIIYTEKPVYFSGEKKKGLTKTPIRMKADNSRHKLLPESRLNYAKMYTVEHNVKVWFIGEIHENSRNQLAADYREMHPPVFPPPTGGLESTPEETLNYTGGGAESPIMYPAELYDGAGSLSFPDQSGSPQYQSMGGAGSSSRGAYEGHETGNTGQFYDPAAQGDIYSNDDYPQYNQHHGGHNENDTAEMGYDDE